jgi:FHA domain
MRSAIDPGGRTRLCGQADRPTEGDPMKPLNDVLGIMHPVGGGDPIPLLKPEIVVGRRPSCDIRLDFENVSGKHCVLRFLNGLWMVRDLGSTNGTTVNGSLLSSEQSIMPDEEVGFAGHLFTIDYEPAGPEAFLTSHKDLDEEVVVERERHSLMDLAGLDTDESKPKRPKRAPTVIERVSAEEGEFDDAVPQHFKNAPKPKKQPTDDDFFKIIEDDVKKPS